MIRTCPAAVLLAIAWVAAAAPAFADDACVDFKWDVSQERALFAGSATPLAAGADAKSAPAMQLNHLYELKLAAQEQVSFAVTPGKKSPREGSHGGLATFKILGSGSYPVALDMPFWIDVVSNGALIAATDFPGQHGCASPPKIVQVDLPGNRACWKLPRVPWTRAVVALPADRQAPAGRGPERRGTRRSWRMQDAWPSPQTAVDW